MSSIVPVLFLVGILALMLVAVVNGKQIARRMALRRLRSCEERIDSARSALSRSITPPALRDPAARLNHLELLQNADTRARDLRQEASELLAEESKLGFWERLEANHKQWLAIEQKAKSIALLVPDALDDYGFDHPWS